MLRVRSLTHLRCRQFAPFSTLKSDFSRSKIIATIGPATDNTAVLTEAYKAGMRIARFNCAHSSHEEIEERMHQLRQVNVKLHSSQEGSMQHEADLLQLVNIQYFSWTLMENQLKILRSCWTYKDLKFEQAVSVMPVRDILQPDTTYIDIIN